MVRDETLLGELRARTWDGYLDFQPFARQYLREALGEDVNLDRLGELAGHLRDALRQLRELGQPPREVFAADPRATNSAKYLLIVAAEAALDIGNQLAARRGARSPEDYADCMGNHGRDRPRRPRPQDPADADVAVPEPAGPPLCASERR